MNINEGQHNGGLHGSLDLGLNYIQILGDTNSISKT